MELRHLRYFVAVAEELHFGRAAERLHMAQPPLSLQIQALERELGVRLFERTRRRVVLTEAGRLFLAEANATLAQAGRAVTVAQRSARGEMGRIEVGFTPGAPFNAFLPTIIRRYRDSFPAVDLVLRELNTSQQITALQEGKLDVGFVRPPLNLSAEDLRLITILHEPLVLALQEEHPLAKQRTIAIADLAGEPFIMYPREVAANLYDLIVALCRKAGFNPRVVQEARQMATIISLVSAGLGVSLVPVSLTQVHMHGVVYRNLPEPPPTLQLALAHRRNDGSATVRELVRLVRAETRGPAGKPAPLR
jgi:DNA-binding transcriptional LysR family regulator